MDNFQRSCIGVIGYGAVGEEIVRCLECRGQMEALVGMLDLPERISALKGKAKGRFPVVGTLPELLELGPNVVVEAAGHTAVRRFGLEALKAGFEVIIASVGALADQTLAAQIVDVAAPGAKLWIASGAVAGIDGLLAAKTLGTREVKYTSVKAPKAWDGTKAQTILDRSAESRRVIFFEGSARQAALEYPQNANVAATVAFASLGLDRTRVQLVSDPTVAGPLGIIEAEGDFGRFVFEILALASPSNPKTSAITGHSLVAAALDGMRFPVLEMLRVS